MTKDDHPAANPDGDVYGADYYHGNGQAGDRPALAWYARLVHRWVPRGSYLDFGCGTGHLLRRLSRFGPADGFEISEYSAETSRKNAPACRVFTRIEQIPSGSYDAITAIHVVEHMDDEVTASVVATWHRALRPGGVALVVTPDLGGKAQELHQEAWNAYTDPTHINLKTHAKWREFFLRQGFSVEREGSDGLWNAPYRRLPKLLDAGLHSGPSLIQFLSGRLFLKPGSGESALFVLRRL